jgi:nucleotide-binding universal stress UspA family protein
MAIDTGSHIENVVDARALFSRILVGIDASSESLEAVRQAALLVQPDGELTVLSAWTLPPPIVGLVGPVSYEADDDVYRTRCGEAVARAVLSIPAGLEPTTNVVRGIAWDELIKEIGRGKHTLVVVGSHGIGRIRAILMGSTATEIVHKAPCSVLVARQAGVTFPRHIMVGIDGSPQSASAFVVAQYVAERFGAELWPLVAHGGKGVDKQLVERIIDDHHEDLPDEPRSALVAASADADLLVLGSRGLHGLRALGSVSEHAAHRARCSTLIVRDPSMRERPARPRAG